MLGKSQISQLCSPVWPVPVPKRAGEPGRLSQGRNPTRQLKRDSSNQASRSLQRAKPDFTWKCTEQIFLHLNISLAVIISPILWNFIQKKTFEVQISTMVTWHLSVVLCSILQFKRLVSESYSALYITCGVGWLGYGGRMGNRYLAGGGVPLRGQALTPDGIHLGILAAIGH